jgi:predicted transcriptional regulator
MQREADQSRIILDILESVDRDSGRSQRSRASEVGIALGLINAYLKFCMRKGYLKARKISARSYQYMLTPKGFAEKSRLALSRLSDSLDFVRGARSEYAAVFADAEARHWTHMVLVGASLLVEISAICALERGIRIVAIVDSAAGTEQMLGVPVHRDFASIAEKYDGVMIADLQDPGKTLAEAEAALGAERVLMPPFLRAGLPHREAT